jgi:hypothetical protein
MRKTFDCGCDCPGGKKWCSHLRVVDYGEGDYEIQVKGYGKIKVSIYLSKKNIKKLIKYLQK